MLKKAAFVLICILAFPLFCHGAEKIRLQIRIGDSVVEGTLEDNPVTRQLMDLSPMQMEMKDYNGHERIGYPSQKLYTKGASTGLAPNEGDIALFAPWGNLCVFIKGSPRSDGLIYLGKINSGLDILKSQKGSFKSQWIISN